ncbi:uncharacterized protein EI90DRAFT_3031518, partial [Cantharellus anzutake]|uniref:uncharacterized protein n=1 Tax=Cantharellus anzutake TaxID=1750568 RepID=UPI0019049E6A
GAQLEGGPRAPVGNQSVSGSPVLLDGTRGSKKDAASATRRERCASVMSQLVLVFLMSEVSSARPDAARAHSHYASVSASPNLSPILPEDSLLTPPLSPKAPLHLADSPQPHQPSHPESASGIRRYDTIATIAALRSFLYLSVIVCFDPRSLPAAMRPTPLLILVCFRTLRPSARVLRFHSFLPPIYILYTTL